MGIRSRAASHTRCPHCRLRLEDCLCAELTRIAPRLDLVIVRHSQEQHKPTSTTGLVLQCVEGAREVTWMGRAIPVDLGLPPDDSFVLFPPQEGPSVPAASLGSWPRRPTVVVLDGTWRQCRKMRRHVPGLATLPAISLPPGPASRPAMRLQVREGGLATAEAVARLLDETEGLGGPLQVAYREMVRRVLTSRGTWAREMARLEE